MSLWIFLLGASFVASVSAECGKPFVVPPSADQRILGGGDSIRGRFPWNVWLETKHPHSGEWDYVCGGTLIDVNWVVTAARCVFNLTENVRITAGDYDRSVNEGSEQNIGVPEIIVHPDFQAEGPFPNDIALLRLDTPADVSSDYVNTICLPRDGNFSYAENPNCQMTSWGTTSGPGGNPTDILQMSTIDVLNNDACQLRVGVLALILDTQICTYDQVDRYVSLCDYDAGSPLQCLIDANYEIAGVASYPSSDVCDREPSVYTNVPSFYNWIIGTLGFVPA